LPGRTICVRPGLFPASHERTTISVLLALTALRLREDRLAVTHYCQGQVELLGDLELAADPSLTVIEHEHSLANHLQ